MLGRWRTDDGACLSVDVRGARNPRTTVVLAHGWCLNRRSWDAVADTLLTADPSLRVVTYDQRGHGASQEPRGTRERGRPSIGRLGDDLATVVRSVAPHGRLVLAGHSMGGMTVMAAVGRHQRLVDRLDGVALVATSASLAELARRERSADREARDSETPQERRRRVRRSAVPHAMRALALVPPLPAALTTQGLGAPLAPLAPRVRFGTAATRRLLFGPDAAPDVVTAVHTAVGRTRLRTVGGYYVHALSRHDERESLARLAQVPTTVVAGDVDRLLPLHHAEAICQVLPTARLVRLERTGHMVPVERPDAVALELQALAGRGAS